MSMRLPPPDAAREIQEGVEEYHREKTSGPWSPNLDSPAIEDCKTQEQAELLKAIREYVKDASGVFYERMKDILKNYRYGGGREISQRIMDFLEKKDMMLPTYRFRFGEEGKKMLGKVGLDDNVSNISENEGVLLFQLPKHLAVFWRKSSRRGFNGRKDEPQNIEWGSIYEQVMPAVWAVVDDWVYGDKLEFLRVNDVGVHDPDEYYYVWITSKPKRK